MAAVEMAAHEAAEARTGAAARLLGQLQAEAIDWTVLSRAPTRSS